MDSVESNPVETQPEELTDLAKAMLGAAEPEKAEVPPPTPPETETPEAEQVETATDEPEAPETEAAPKSIKELAEKLGISAKELYGVQVAMPDGSEMTLGALKDGHQTGEALSTSQAELDTRRVEFDTRMSHQAHESAAVAVLIGMDRLTEAEMQKVQGVLQQRRDREAKAMLDSTPEWSDSVQRLADAKLMIADVAGFGLTEADLGLIDDHRLIRYIRHHALKNDRAKPAAKVPPKGQKPSSKAVKPRDDLKTIVAEAKSGKRDERTALGDVLRAQRV